MSRLVYFLAVYAVVVGVTGWFAGWIVATGVAVFGLLWLAFAFRHPRGKPTRAG